MDLETVWTGAYDVLKAKAQQLPSPRLMADADPAAPEPQKRYGAPVTIREWLLSRPKGHIYTQQQIRRATKGCKSAVYKVLTDLVKGGVYEKIATGAASQEGPLYLYRRVKEAACISDAA